jgi:hypothetical protein
MRERANAVRRGRNEATSAAGMERDEIHERSAPACELGETYRVLHSIIHPAQHHIFESDATVELLRGLDHVVQRVLDVHRHELASERVCRGVNRDRETELFRPLAERDDARQYADGRDRDMPRPDPEA